MSDLIKREDAIKAIHNYWKKRLDTLPTKESQCGEVYADIQEMDKILEHNKTLCNFIDAIPSADRPQEWIPCSERVPRGSDGISECEMVLMTLSVGYVACGWINGDTAYVLINNPTYDQIVIADSKEVIAWMPLPKPWKGADDERDR